MHELAFTEGIIKLISQEAEKQGFTKCYSITLSVGDMSGIVPECIEGFFPIAAEGTIAEGARLYFNRCEESAGCYIDSIEVE